MLKILCNSSTHLSTAKSLSQTLSIPLQENQTLESLPQDSLVLVFDENGASLSIIDAQKTGKVKVDFLEGKLGYRLRHQESKPLIAKAIGIKPKSKPLVWDMTAGLGQDAFVLAKLGCAVRMHERNPIVHCLLADGLRRAREAAEQSSDELLQSLLDNLSLIEADSLSELSTLIQEDSRQKPDVIYLDPMFPERKKSAKVKKGMQLFHQLVGRDEDAADAFNLAMQAAKKRVVVKRPKGAEILGDKKPSLQFQGKSLRFDVYLLSE